MISLPSGPLLVPGLLPSAVGALILTGTTPVTPPTPSGFYLNGSGNPALKAMLSRVAGAAGRGRIAMPGDSLFTSQGAGTSADSYGLTNARPNRHAAVLATKLSAAGYPALDNANYGDQGVGVAGGFLLPAYDTRITMGSWSVSRDPTDAGGGYLAANTGAPFTFTPTTPVDTFEFYAYNSNNFALTFAIDGAAPAQITASGGGTASGTTVTVTQTNSGLTKIIVKAASVGIHTLQVTANNTVGAIRSVHAYASTVSAIDILTQSCCGVKASQVATSNAAGWGARDQITYDAPNLTIIQLGGNEVNAGDSAASMKAALQSIVATAKAVGDVLLCWYHPGAGNLSGSGVAPYMQAASEVAAANGVAFMNFNEYFGGVFTSALQARMFDGIVHGRADIVAEEADVMMQCLRVMQNSVAAPTIAFANLTASIAEGNSGTKVVTNTVNVTRNGVTGALAVALAYSGTATAGTDYAVGPTSVTIAGGTSAVSFDILINGDTTVEPDETIVISAALSAFPSATATKTITITNDDSSGVPNPANNATITGGAYDAGGKFGQARSAGYGKAPALAANTNTTVEGWIKSTSTDYVLIASQLGVFWFGMYQGKALYIIEGTGDNDRRVGTATLNDGQWHHYALGFSNAGAKLYVDGALVISDTAARTLGWTNTNYGLVLDAYGNGATPAAVAPTGSLIDEVAVWGIDKYPAAFTPPTAAYVGTEAGLLRLYHRDGDGLNAATA